MMMMHITESADKNYKLGQSDSTYTGRCKKKTFGKTEVMVWMTWISGTERKRTEHLADCFT